MLIHDIETLMQFYIDHRWNPSVNFEKRAEIIITSDSDMVKTNIQTPALVIKCILIKAIKA